MSAPPRDFWPDRVKFATRRARSEFNRTHRRVSAQQYETLSDAGQLDPNCLYLIVEDSAGEDTP